MADITERIVIPEVPRVLDGQELYVYIPKAAIFDLNIEKGTGNVLVQTTDPDHSFKVMTDGRAKVRSAPIESNDVVRKSELDTKLDKGLIPSEYLPSYVDDVVEYDSKNDFPEPGETGKIYVDKSTNLTYRWSGSTYIMVGGGDLNLENGAGKGSLIQKTVSSSGTPYNNQASGPASIAFGKNTKAQGNTDFVIGQNNEDNSSGSFVGGSNCENTGNYAFVFGRYLNNTQIGAVRLGYYNKDNDYTAFSIGIGDVDNRKNGLEYDAYTNTLSIPTGDIIYGTNLQGNNANFSGEVKIGKHFIGELGGPFVFKVGSYNKTPDVSGFEIDRDGNTTFFGKLKSGRTPVEDTDVVRKLELDEVKEYINEKISKIDTNALKVTVW